MLDPVALSAIADLELVSRRVVDGTISGLHRSPFHGYSAEFSQYRHYRPGDDLKYVDWKLFARTDRVYTKQFRETTNLMCSIALDASASMDYAPVRRSLGEGGGGVTKFQYARLLAASIANLVSRQGDAVGLVAFADGLKSYLPSRGGQVHLRSLLLTLEKAQPSGTTGIAEALSRTLELLKRRGLLVLISDLYDEAPGVEQALKRAAHTGHEVILFHVLTRDEVELPFRGDVEVVDAETGSAVLTDGSSYMEKMSEFLERWRSRSTAYGLDYVRVFTDTPLDAALRGYLRRRTLGVVA